MTRRSMPERITVNIRLPRGEWGYWEIIRDLDVAGPWTVPAIEAETCDRKSCIARYVQRLVKAGIARLVAAETRQNRPLAKQYRLVSRPKDAPRIRADGSLIVSTGQECLWRGMRVLKTFNVRELAIASRTEGVKVTEAMAQRYVELLARAGYLALAKERTGKFGLRTWRLKPAMNTGPLSPTILHAVAIYDRNLRKVMGDDVTAREVAS